MPRIRAGLLMYRIMDSVAQILLAHRGGPFFRNKDDGAWSIPNSPSSCCGSPSCRESEPWQRR